MLHPKLTRRHFIAGSAAFSALAMLPGRVWAEGGTLKIQTYDTLNSLDPAFQVNQNEEAVLQAVMPRLISYNEGDWGWSLLDAESIDVIDPTHIRFKVKPGMMWSGGFGEVTAEDVKFSYERIVDPALASPYKDDWSALDRVEVEDKHTGVIILKEPNVTVFAVALPKGTGTILCKAAVEALPEKKYAMTLPASCGPYRITRWEPNQILVMERNPDWRGEPGHFEQIHVMPIIDLQVAETAFAAGELGATQVPMAAISRLKAQPPKNSQLISGPALNYFWLGMQTEHPNFSDVRVRKAVQMTIDRQAIIDSAFFGVALPSNGMIVPTMLGHRDESLLPEKPDLDAARKLLVEAGKGDGFATTLVTRTNLESTTAAEVIAQQLGEIGIQVEIRPEDTSTIWDRAQSADGWKDDQLIFWRYNCAADPSWFTAWFTPDQVGQWNWERWNNPEFGELHKAALVEGDAEKRAGMYRRMQDLMDESGAYVFVCHGINAWVHDASIKLSVAPDFYLPSYRRTAPV